MNGLRGRKLSERFVCLGLPRDLLRSDSGTVVAVSIHACDGEDGIDAGSGGVGVIKEKSAFRRSTNNFSVLLDVVVGNPIVIMAGRPAEFDPLDTKIRCQSFGNV